MLLEDKVPSQAGGGELVHIGSYHVHHAIVTTRWEQYDCPKVCAVYTVFLKVLGQSRVAVRTLIRSNVMKCGRALERLYACL
jgi:hypothetical protein